MGTMVEAPSGRDFDNVFGAGMSPSGALRNGGVSDRLRDRLVREEHAKLHRQGWQPVTVVNLQPFALQANLGELGMIEVPAATPEQPVRTLVIQHYRMSMRDLGDGNFTPVSILPSELAKEIEREYGATGGVFWYHGTGEPEAAQVEAARARQQSWWRQLYQQAVDSWSRYHQHKLITDRQRDAARAMFAAGEVAGLPEWVTITRAQADRRDCPMCGESIKVAAKICHFCRSEFGAEGEPVRAAAAPKRAAKPGAHEE
ncbi:MAG TPA: hypothetical protein VNF74_11395 [Terriglobales bacterium]|nr:hypothetical protein [Terriglobales bacterium]